LEDLQKLFDKRLGRLRGLENGIIPGENRLRGVYRRSNAEQSIQYLDALGLLSSIPKRKPESACVEAQDSRLSYYKEDFQNAHFTSLTLQELQIISCAFDACSFRNSDINQCELKRTDFIDVDFSRAILADSNLRTSSFSLCQFIKSDLSGVDFRSTKIVDCDFTKAKMAGAKFDLSMKETLPLTDFQIATIDWIGEEE